ncbi:phosphoribosylformylglycinamidine synthase subunit PurS [Endomicrobium sp. AH-315-J14]|nr:phosphoribosylformylglycinamidine synthase subunit PurS [Endomicrobium sp. AH-315-J14]
MKAVVYVRLKKEVLDPQGEAVRRALGSMGFEGVSGVRIGKLIELEIEGDGGDELQGRLEKMADQLLANPVIEDYEIKLS